MLSDPLLVGIAHGLVFIVGFSVARKIAALAVADGSTTLRVFGGFIVGLFLGWLAGVLTGALMLTLVRSVMQHAASADSTFLALIGKSFWISAFGAGYATWFHKKEATPEIDKPSQIVAEGTKPLSPSNDAYAVAMAEIEEGRVDRGTWARCYALSDGDESKTRARYINARVGAGAGVVAADVWANTQPQVTGDAAANPKIDDSNLKPVDGSRALPPVIKAGAIVVLLVLLGNVVLPGFRDGLWGTEPPVTTTNFGERDKVESAMQFAENNPTVVSPAPSAPDWSSGVITQPTAQGQPAPNPTLKISPPIVSDYQRAEILAFEAKERARVAKIEADLKEVSDRALKDYPYLDTPAGEEDLNKIIAKRNEMIQEGVYPSLALTRAVLAVAKYRERPPGQEPRKLNSEPVSVKAQ